MKKSILTALALLMVIVFCFSGCNAGGGESTTNLKQSVRDAITLNFCIITDDSTTDAAKDRVQAAFNKITETTYSTHVEFTFCTAAEYRAKVDAMMEEAALLADIGYEDDAATGVETTRNELNQVVTKYPDLRDGQIDIVLVKGLDMLNSYVDAGHLLPLTSYVKGDYKTLKSFIYGGLLESAYFVDVEGVSTPNSIVTDSAPYTGTIYAIPNNSLIGNYTYLLINKELATEFYYGENDIRSLTDEACLDLARLVYEKYGNTSAVCPVLEFADFPTLINWPLTSKKSIAVTPYRSNEEIGAEKNCVNMLSNSNFVSWYNAMVSFTEKGYFAADPTTQEKFGVGVVSGNYGDRFKYTDDYYVRTINTPRIEEEDVFGSMYGVSSYSRYPDRAMEIVAALTTNAELINTLQYGVADVDYRIEDDGSLVRLKNLDGKVEYRMDIRNVGNELLAYPEEGEDPVSWNASLMYQNRDAKLSVVFGFSPFLKAITAAQTTALESLADEYYTKIRNCATLEELSSVISTGKSAVSSNSAASAVIRSVNASLLEWFEAYFYVEEE